MGKRIELTAAELTARCDASLYRFKDTGEVPPLDGVIGQERAVNALDFGINMKGPGYNIYVTGQPGTGKATIVRELVEKHAVNRPSPPDWCMVNNFKDEYRPRPVKVPSGGAYAFARRINRLMAELRSSISKGYRDDEFKKKQDEIKTHFENTKREQFEKITASAKEKGLGVTRTPSGFQAIPLKDGEPLRPEAFSALPDEEKKEYERNMTAMNEEIEAMARELQKIRSERQKETEELSESMARFIVKDRIDHVREEYMKWPGVCSFLSTLQSDIVENVKYFLAEAAKGDMSQEDQAALEAFFGRYRVNVLTHVESDHGAPVVFEPNPSYQNLFGRIEKRAVMGTVTTDFSMVQAGSLLQANGGFLITEVESLLLNPGVWEAFKRALQNKELYIEDQAVGMGFATASLRPQPIPLDVKVILIGGYQTFALLSAHDLKFSKIFKVRADFDHETGRESDSLNQYASFVARVCKEEELRPFTPDGVAMVVEFGQKMIGDQRKLSLRFGPIVDIIKEAEYQAAKEEAPHVTGLHVERAVEEYRFRHNLYEEKVHERYADGTILIEVDGAKVGQVNALAVYQVGEFAFGRPSRITAETFMGKPGVVNIEREADLSGKTHDKGVMILSGFLGRTFAQKFPLSLSISITFEQSYGGVDGDSASSTELYAILSSLSGVPIRQGIAVTGSVNQKGEIQAIGGVNQKIEGFFDVCTAKGLTGGQGVMIPAANALNLILRKDVVEAVRQGRFHVWAVETVARGIEVLTGEPAGEPGTDGRFPEDSVFGKAHAALKADFQRSLRYRRDSWDAVRQSE